MYCYPLCLSRASMVKLIHKWIPTHASLCRQGREHSPLCPRCGSTVETEDHVFKCPDNNARTQCMDLLQAFLQSLLTVNKSILLLVCFKYKLSLALSLNYVRKFTSATALSREQATFNVAWGNQTSKQNRMGPLLEGLHIFQMAWGSHCHKCEYTRIPMALI